MGCDCTLSVYLILSIPTPSFGLDKCVLRWLVGPKDFSPGEQEDAHYFHTQPAIHIAVLVNIQVNQYLS